MEACIRVAETARRYLGRLEVDGPNRSPWIDDLNTRSGAPLGSSWCASFALGCVSEVANRFGHGTLLKASYHVKTLWNLNREEAGTKFPQVGFLVCWVKKGTIQGHCGVVVEVDPKGEWFRSIEGNTRSSEGIDREGDGVFLKHHFLKDHPSAFQLLGFLRPF